MAAAAAADDNDGPDGGVSADTHHTHAYTVDETTEAAAARRTDDGTRRKRAHASGTRRATDGHQRTAFSNGYQTARATGETTSTTAETPEIHANRSALDGKLLAWDPVTRARKLQYVDATPGGTIYTRTSDPLAAYAHTYVRTHCGRNNNKNNIL